MCQMLSQPSRHPDSSRVVRRVFDYCVHDADLPRHPPVSRPAPLSLPDVAAQPHAKKSILIRDASRGPRHGRRTPTVRQKNSPTCCTLCVSLLPIAPSSPTRLGRPTGSRSAASPTDTRNTPNALERSQPASPRVTLRTPSALVRERWRSPSTTPRQRVRPLSSPSEPLWQAADAAAEHTAAADARAQHNASQVRKRPLHVHLNPSLQPLAPWHSTTPAKCAGGHCTCTSILLAAGG